MLSYIGEQPLNANVELRNLKGNVYLLKYEYNPLSFLNSVW